MNAVQSLTKIEAAADELRSGMGTDNSGLIDVWQIVEALGGEVHVVFEPADRPASLQVRAKDDFTVILPWNTSVVRDRFTIAHELGHLLLHYDGGICAFYRYGQDREEHEANAFAAALLMPRTDFEHQYKTEDGDLRMVAERFGVSVSAANVRASVLNLI